VEVIQDPMRTERHSRPVAWHVIAVLSAVTFLVYETVFGSDLIAQDVLYPIFPILAVGGGLVAALRSDRVHRWAWWAFTAGVTLIAAGDITWTVLDLAGLTPYPSLADAFYLSGVLALVLGTWWICTPQPIADREGLIDAVIVAIAGAVALWFLIAERSIATSTSPESTLVALAYPFMDAAIVGIVARVLLGRHHQSVAVRLLMVGISAYFASDVVYAAQILDGTYVGGIVDVGWMVGYAFFGVAAAHPSAARPVADVDGVFRFSRRLLVLLTLASLLAPLLTLVTMARADPVDVAFSAVASIVLFLLVVLRMDGAFSNVKRSLAQRGELEERLRHQAMHDPLTGLGNRAMLIDVLDDMLAGAPERVAVILIDLDDFKSVNDTLGHQAGDELIVEVATRLMSASRSTDLIARLGGDEFAIIVSDRTGGGALAAARRALEALRPAAEVAGHQVFVDASIGVATGQAGMEPGDLLRDADIAMYLAKSQGKGRVEVFEATMRADVLHRVQLRSELAEAIEMERLVVHYQPIVGLADGRVRKLEALVRWDHPVRGLLPPDDFIPLAEATGLVVPLGRWVLREACQQAAGWNAASPEAIGIAVNVASSQLRHPAFLADVSAALRDSGLAADLLTLELTESDVVELEASSRTLRDLRELGVHLAIDDFGTGYSSLSYLSQLPIDLIKIDRSFIATLGNADSGAAIASTILAIGRTLNVETVAEGIEEPEQLAALRRLGCGLGQGFLFARPVPAEDIPSILAAGIAQDGEAA
jgi:diguanylate cyclase